MTWSSRPSLECIKACLIRSEQVRSGRIIPGLRHSWWIQYTQWSFPSSWTCMNDSCLKSLLKQKYTPVLWFSQKHHKSKIDCHLLRPIEHRYGLSRSKVPHCTAKEKSDACDPADRQEYFCACTWLLSKMCIKIRTVSQNLLLHLWDSCKSSFALFSVCAYFWSAPWAQNIPYHASKRRKDSLCTVFAWILRFNSLCSGGLCHEVDSDILLIACALRFDIQEIGVQEHLCSSGHNFGCVPRFQMVGAILNHET